MENSSVYVRNISKDKKYEFTLSVYIENCSRRVYSQTDSIKYFEEQETIILNPGEKRRIGSISAYSWWNGGTGIHSYEKDYRCINDISKITQAVPFQNF